ncbi:uncharacterized protein LOC118477470 [Aplysia californica]|uniref:Uncharacterized protein LOC118477470 n=1 Tax=Aplysia californica TaxID=6500 RepID=A0ABM1VR46_APLCA|nr:uncharacterized protein LOC118477470 [Aplysia californica]
MTNEILFSFPFYSKWKVWVGVVVNSSLSGPLTWEDGSPVWYPTADLRSRADPDSDQCLTMETLSPYRWGLVNCSQRFPYLCSVDEGVCVYEVTPTSSLVGYNTAKFFEQDREGCRKLCDENKDFTCRSFEYSKWHFCQLSEVNRYQFIV